MTAKSNAQRQREYRQRQRDMGHPEVRGIYLPVELHRKLREYARRIRPKS